MTDQAAASPPPPPNHPFEGNSYTPPPLPPTKKPNKALKIFGIVVAVVVGLAVLSAIFGGGKSTPKPTHNPIPSHHNVTPTEPPAQSYADWKASFAPVFAQTQADWQTTANALANGDQQGSLDGFAAVSQDGAEIANYANSPDPVLNDYINTLAYDYLQVAQIGSDLAQNGEAGASYSLADFKDAITTLDSDASATADELQVASQNY